jgi:hypothetical protein
MTYVVHPDLMIRPVYNLGGLLYPSLKNIAHIPLRSGTLNVYLYRYEWVSECCLAPTQQLFSYIMTWREQIHFQWDDDDDGVRFVLCQHA